MNRVVTSKECILEASRSLIVEQGWTAVNIRSVASRCGVSVGSIYNYYASKGELTAAAVESIWREIFHRPAGEPDFEDFLELIVWFYHRMEDGGRRYPGFFTFHSMSFLGGDKLEGRQVMGRVWEHMKQMLCKALENDRDVRENAFDEQFTREKFVELVFSILLSSMVKEEYDSFAVTEVIRRTIYK